MADVQSAEELEDNLLEYRQQLQQVEDLLLNDHENADLSDMYNSLVEVIQLTEDLLIDAKVQEAASTTGASAPAAAVGASVSAAVAVAGPSSGFSSAPIVIPQQINLSSLLPAAVADQIRKAQQRAALLGQAPGIWAVGSKCQAVYSLDSEWYEATVEATIAGGGFRVVFDGYNNQEEVDLTKIRPIPEAGEIYQGVAAPKRKKVEEEPVVGEVPKWLEIKPTDDEKVVTRKKKLMKSYKSKIRFQNMDMTQKVKQDSWKNFQTGKGAKKKAGFFGAKKESMFKVPEGSNGKVGVVGSGKGMTDYSKRGRHEFELDD